MRCEKCGNELLQEDKACKACGHPVGEKQADEKTVSENPAGDNSVVGTPASESSTGENSVDESPAGETSTKESRPSKKAKKKHGCLIALLIMLGLIGVGVLCIAIFLPGFFRPKSLGIKVSKEAYDSAINKLYKDTTPLEKGASDSQSDRDTYKEPVEVEASLTSEEVSALVNYNKEKYYAYDKVQIKVNPDDTIEFSGSVDTDYFLDEFLGGEYSKEEIIESFPIIKAIPDSVNVYLKMSGGIEDNKTVDFALNDIEILGIDIPSSLYEELSAQEEISDMLDDFLTRKAEKTKDSYASVKPEGGELQIIGSLTR